MFLTFSCIGYAMPFILCATICCCLPCIISILGVREDLTQTRGATSESINTLPTYKFKVKKRKNSDKTSDESNSNVFEGGVVAAGTEKERVISGEDAVSGYIKVYIFTSRPRVNYHKLFVIVLENPAIQFAFFITLDYDCFSFCSIGLFCWT